MEDKNKTNYKKFLTSFSRRYHHSYLDELSATYTSIVNYKLDLQKPIQRWYRYKEGYSLDLNYKIFEEERTTTNDLILDPFCGGGSTLLASKAKGIGSIGFEVNPFVAFLAGVKTENYTLTDINRFSGYLQEVVDSAEKSHFRPNLSILPNLFLPTTREYLFSVRDTITKIRDVKIRNLYLLAWLSILEVSSNYRKAGNGLKIRRAASFKPKDKNQVRKLLQSKIEDIAADLEYALSLPSVKADVFNESSFFLENRLPKNSISGVIFSPPYANCFDYTEIYKVELWLGGFVKSNEEMRALRREQVRNNLNSLNGRDEVIETDSLSFIVETLHKTRLWDKRIPKMIEGYFTDLFTVLGQLFDILKSGGFCKIVVSNSAYSGLVIPTDLLLAELAEKIGFKAEKVEVARAIITSSQQYNKTKDMGMYLREGIVHLRKP